MMTSIGRNAVRFKDTPVFSRIPEDSMSSSDSTLLKALQLNESSSILSDVANEKSCIADSPNERVQWVGRTPHSKVLDAKRSRKALDELMKMPELAPLNNSVLGPLNHSVLTIPFHEQVTVSEDSISDISFSPAVRGQVTATPFVQPVKANKGFLDTPFLQNEALQSIAKSTPSSHESNSFDLLSTEADRILSSMPDTTPVSTRSQKQFAISPLSEPSISNAPTSMVHHPPTPYRMQYTAFEHDENGSLKKPIVKSLSKPLRTLNQNIATFERPRQVEDSATKPYRASNSFVTTPILAKDKENLSRLREDRALITQDVEVDVESQILPKANDIPIKKDEVAEVPPPNHFCTVTLNSQEDTFRLSLGLSPDTPGSHHVEIGNRVDSICFSDNSGVSAEMKPKIIRSVNFENLDLPQTKNKPPEFVPVTNDDLSHQTLQTMTRGKKDVDHPINIESGGASVNFLSDEGVSLGKGPIFACARAKRVVYHRTKMIQPLEQKDKLVPACPIDAPSVKQTLSSTCTTENLPINTLHLANTWATPRNTRKTIPHNYFINEKVEVPIITNAHQDQPVSTVELQKPVIVLTSTLPEKNMEVSSQFASKFVHHDVSIQVDKELLAYQINKRDCAVQSSFDSMVENGNLNLSPSSNSNLPQNIQRNEYDTLKNICDNSVCSYTLEELLPKYQSEQNSPIIASYSSTPSRTYSQRFDTKSCCVSSDKATTKNPVTDGSSMLSTRSAGMGSATRIVVANREKYMDEQWNNQQLPWNYFNNYEDFEENEMVHESAYCQEPKDLTLLTDIAVASFTQTMLVDDEENQTLPSIGCNTTFTLDQSCDHSKISRLSDETIEQTFPKISIKSLKRSPDSPLDVKEINFDTAPGEFTTVMLTFNNHRPKELTLLTDCVVLRVEPSYSGRSQSTSVNVQSRPDSHEYFTVSPKAITIPENGQGVIFVTFSPAAETEGIYSGAMRIRYGNKSYTMLLRGESCFDFSMSSPVVVSNNNFECREEAMTLPSNTIVSSLLIAEEDRNAIIQRQNNPNMVTPASVFQKKLRVLQEKIAEISRKMLWGEDTPTKDVVRSALSSSENIPLADIGASESDQVQFITTQKDTLLGPTSSKSATSIKTIDAMTDIVLFPPTLSFSNSDSKSTLTISNNSNRPKIIRLASSLSENIVLSTTLATVTPYSQYKVDIHIENLSRDMLSGVKSLNIKKISKHELYHFGSIQCSFDSQHVTVPVSINGSLIKPYFFSMKTPSSVFKSLTWTTDTKGGEGFNETNATKPDSVFYDGDFETTKLKNSSIAFTESYSVEGDAATDPARKSIESKIVQSHLEQRITEEIVAADVLTQHNYIEFDSVQNNNHVTASSGASIASSCITSQKPGLYFRKAHAQFGSVAIGNLVRTKIELCNPTNQELVVYVGELKLPFVVLHNEIHMRPRSYIRIPVRFVPTAAGEFSADLIAQTSDGKHISIIKLSGYGYD